MRREFVPIAGTEKRCKHNWKPLFTKPTPQDSIELRMDYLFLREDAEALTCTDCNALAYPSHGYSRGGTHKIKIVREDAINAQSIADLKARAEQWNRKETANA